MTAVTLGFKAFDAHELLCHFVAVNSDLYRRHGLQVNLADITFIPDTELPRHWVQASCGAALNSAVNGIEQRVVFVATDKPMFWIYARPDLNAVGELKNKRLATFPAVAPPHHLANLILARAGLDVPADVTLHSARDDVARLGLLRSGHVDAAVISSAVAPPRMTALGFNTLCFFGDEIRIPTTGLSLHQDLLDEQADLVKHLVDTHRESLLQIHHDTAMVGKVLQEYFDVAPEIAEATARLYQSCFTRDGKTAPEIAQAAIDALSKSSKDGAAIPWRQIYRFQLTGENPGR